MVAVSTVSPAETMNWANQRAGARSTLLSSQAQNLYQQQLAGIGFGQQRAQMGRQFDQQREGIPSTFARRGTLQSGLYKDALSKYAQERLGAFGGLQQQQQVTNGQFAINAQGFENSYAATIQRILAEQYARQAQSAAGVGGWIG